MMNSYANPSALSLLQMAAKSNQPIPNLSKLDKFNIAAAYEVQSAYVKSRMEKDGIAGFKAGLTSEDAQHSFGINRPIFGVLFANGDFTHKKEISLKKTHLLMVETEIGFITNKQIKNTVNSIDELKTYIDHIVPVIEFPDVGFESKSFNAVDLVAGNTGSYGFIVHTGMNWRNEDVNSITVSLFHNDNIVNQGRSIDAMGDQWEALRWLVNQVIAHGWTIEKGHLLITGALGNILDAQPGTYKARFNNHAEIEFTVSS